MTAAAMNPFDQLLRAAEKRQAHVRMNGEAPHNPARDSMTRELVQHLRQVGPSSTSSLCHVVDRESRLVWGLLKGPRAAGEVVYAAGLWSASADFDVKLQAELDAAAALLRRHGWVVRRQGRPPAAW